MKIQRIETIFKRLSELVINLPPDPSALGPDYLREQISICRGYLNEASMFLQEVLTERALLTMKLDAMETEFAIKSDDLLTGDSRVKILPALADRQAMINTILSTDRKAIEGVRLELKGSAQVEKIIRHRAKELDNTMSAIRLQRSLLHDQLRTGSFYGDESETSRGSKDPISEWSGDDLDKYLENLDEGAAGEQESDSAPPIDKELEEALENILDEDIDETPPKPSKKKAKSGPPSKILVSDPSGLSEDDVDKDMQVFLEQEFKEDDLDSII